MKLIKTSKAMANGAILYILFLVLICMQANAQIATFEVKGKTVVAPNETCVYTIVFKDANGNILPPPTLTPYNGYDPYNWNTNNNSITSSSDFTCTVVWDADGGDLIYDAWFTLNGVYGDHLVHYPVIVKDPTPDPVLAVTNNGLLSTGGSVTLSVGNFTYDTYQWQHLDGSPVTGATSPTLTVSQPGSYKILVTKGNSSYTSTVKTIVDQSKVTNMNLVTAATVRVPGVIYQMNMQSLPVASLNQTTQYFDGLGRLVQTVNKQASPTQKDVIQPVVYDDFGRQPFNFLPYVDGSDGQYKINSTQDIAANPYAGNVNLTGVQHAFYQTQMNIANDKYPYGVTLFEASPLNRPTKIYGPGENWQLNQRGTSYSYLTNINGTSGGAERIINWAIDSQGNPQRSSMNYYPTGSLSVKVSQDENGNALREYTTKEGKLILKKVQAVMYLPDPDNRDHWAQTYYIYDDYNNLRIVLQPELVKKVMQNDSYNPTEDDLIKFAFRYKYDERDRLVEKSIPGASITYMVYDKRDRLILTQDGNRREQNEWLFSKYDALNRVVVTGIYRPGSLISRQGMQDIVYGKGVQNAVPPPSPDATRFGTDIVSNQYDGYATYQASHSITLDPGFSFSASDGSSFEATIGDGSQTIDATFPEQNIELLTLTYYDNYTTSQATQSSAYNFVPLVPRVTDIRGLTAVSSVRVLGTANWIHTKMYYDDHNRVVQSISNNILGGTDCNTINYDFNGQVLQQLHTPINYNGKTVLEEFTYDHTGRQLTHRHKVDNNSEITIASNIYNELGQLLTKNQHGTAQSTNYTYNIRGWLSTINDPAALSSNQLFALKLNYEQPETGAATQFNGNIAEAEWKMLGDAKNRGFAYSYDPLNRLTNSVYNDNSGTGWNINNAYSEAITGYDQNGNILGLDRWGIISGSSQHMDALSYTYSGNQVKKIEDTGTNDGFNNGANLPEEYTYDANGSQTSDKNKGVDSIEYNYLNLPNRIVFSNGGWINYTYDAVGKKLKKQSSLTGQTHYYIAEQEFDGSNFDLLHTTEGRWTTGAGYEYFLKDHLGNTRVVFGINSSGIADVKDKTDYYAFGMVMPNSGLTSTGNKYLYNGKEIQEELGQYDYGARFYDPVIARWTSVDPLAEKFRRWSTYNYCDDDPISKIDPDGMGVEKIKPQKKDQQAIVTLINQRSKTQYQVDKNGLLEANKKAPENKNGSSKYSAQINEGIASPKTLTAAIGQTYKGENNQTKSVDLDAGGGVTVTPVKQAVSVMAVDQRPTIAGDPTVIISGNSNPNIPGQTQSRVPDDPSLILMHEFVGHAFPILRGRTSGNAVNNENEIRKELNIPLRQIDPSHKESNTAQ